MAQRALVTGATGYIGGRLAPRLLAAGYTVRCLARDPRKLRDVPWQADVEITPGDITDRDAVRAALTDVDVAYYLVHSMGGVAEFEERDRAAATLFAEEARASGVRRIVYLGGMAPADQHGLSPHLRSRQEVGQLLLDSGVPTAALQAAVILGSGSASFEMLRYLTERLPAMITPVWVRTRIQPIAIRDVLRYLVGAAELPPEVNRRFDVGGPDVLTYEDLMQHYAKVAGLRRRLIVGVPMVSPGLSSHWVNLVTPVPGALAAPLIQSLQHEVVASEHDIADFMPDPAEGLLGVDAAIRLALQRVKDADVPTRWSSASWPGAPSDPLPTDPDWTGGSIYLDERSHRVDASAQQLWAVIEGIGGENGWYSWPLAWSVRGWLDRVSGGVGLRRGRRNPRLLQVGESLDFWRVEDLDRGRLLRLRAEMKVPGVAWLDLSVDTDETGGTVFHQRAAFLPRGLAGHAYWWAVKPFHGVVFGGMLRNIALAAHRVPEPDRAGGDGGVNGGADGADRPNSTDSAAA